MRHTVIVGTGCYIPPRRVRNEDLVSRHYFEGYGKPLDRGHNQRLVRKFQEITGIAERRYVEDDLVASDIALLAAQDAIDDSDVDKEQIDTIIVAHNFGDIRHDSRRSEFVPTLAARVKHRLKIANPECIAYDLPFGCPGWLQGVIQSDCSLRSGEISRALVIGAETLSRVCDPHDRDSLIYADGAGAVVLEARELDSPAGILAHAVRSDTLGDDPLLWMGSSYDVEHPTDGLFLKMHGHQLYQHALKHVPGVVNTSLERAGVALTRVNKVLMHQANAKMNEAILSRLFRSNQVEEIPVGVMPMTISWLGNSSVATVPTLLDLICRGKMEGQAIEAGDVVVFASVGAGMNINSVVYRWV